VGYTAYLSPSPQSPSPPYPSHPQQVSLKLRGGRLRDASMKGRYAWDLILIIKEKQVKMDERKGFKLIYSQEELEETAASSTLEKRL
jgi:hypothetical protein